MDSLNSKPDGDIALTNGNDLAPVHLPKAKPPNTQQELSIEFFRNFLVYLGQKYMELLQEHPDDEAAYRVFLEVIYCRMYLLNRPLARRIESSSLSCRLSSSGELSLLSVERTVF
ncbi:uncharacterized protein LOC103507697 isoform X1 [Diaphorina citri]|uniref:Uncharacterized protein LOC103507697 isoform X1 n=1 Tax=Diaphorina citri TaxID=121845 RepID=A0A1S3CZR8_DIACI|nr:uncharacterized protein LOC103507697 isoform X1 [Diaphorina citri]XP_008470418.1 uncharacterized protein LOC103507697 isoform X1 [Diaphorina citri]